MSNPQIDNFYNGYMDQVTKYDTTLSNLESEIEKKQLEIKYIREVELPTAIELSVLEGDSKAEDKLNKQLEKLNSEVQQATMSIVVIGNAKKNYIQDAADQVEKLLAANKVDRNREEKKAFHRIMNAKLAYINVLIEEGKLLQSEAHTANKIENIKAAAGRHASITDVTVPACMANDNGWNSPKDYMGVTYQEVKRFLTGNYTDHDTAYLQPYKSIKNYN